MERTTILEELNPIFSDVLDEDIELNEQSSANTVDAWDSLNHIRLMMAVEKKFCVDFSASELAALQNIGDLISLIQKKKDA